MILVEVGDFRQFSVAPSDGNEQLDAQTAAFWREQRERERAEIRRRLRGYRVWASAAAAARARAATRDAELIRRAAREQDGGDHHG